MVLFRVVKVGKGCDRGADWPWRVLGDKGVHFRIDRFVLVRVWMVPASSARRRVCVCA